VDLLGMISSWNWCFFPHKESEHSGGHSPPSSAEVWDA
jgi:hypothetical protein